MNRDKFADKWRELKSKVKSKWAKLTDQDIENVHGKWDQLSGQLQKKYGWSREQADREINNLCDSCGPGESKKGHGRDEAPRERDLQNKPAGEFERKGAADTKHHGRDEAPRESNLRNEQEWRQEGEAPRKGAADIKRHGQDEHKDKKRKAG